MQEQKKIYYYIAIGATALTAIILLFSSMKSGKEENVRVSFGKVDNYRLEAIQKRRLETERVKVENFKNAPAISGFQKIEDHDPNKGKIQLESSQNHAARDAAEDRSGGRAMDFSPESQINQMLVNKQKYQQMSAGQKQKYVEDFKKEAKSLGFKIEFNDKLEIIQFQRMPGSTDGGSNDQDLYQGEEFD